MSYNVRVYAMFAVAKRRQIWVERRGTRSGTTYTLLGDVKFYTFCFFSFNQGGGRIRSHNTIFVHFFKSTRSSLAVP